MLTADDKKWLTNVIDGRLDAIEVRMKENTAHAIQDMETRIIAEFWKWGRTADMRYRQDHAALGGLDARIGAIEDRVTELERERGKAQ